MHRSRQPTRLLLLSVLALLLAACATQPTQPTSPSASRLLGQAERLSRAGDYVRAAQAYESLAAQSAAELRDRFLLRAAREYVRAERIDTASTLVKRVSSALPSADCTLRAQVVAQIALAENRPEDALAELNRIPQPVARDALADVLALRARALFATNRPAAGVIVALDRERALTTREEMRENQRLIWEGLQRSAAGAADFRAPPNASSVVKGWLELGEAALIAARNPFAATDDLSDWRSRHPTHPANSLLTEEVLPELGAGLDYPAHIALVLPLSGRQQAAGVAVRDGFLAALLQQDSAQRPLVNVYDSAEMGALTAYRRAIVDGAQFVVGPLTKDEIAAVAESGETSAPTLALNQLADEVQPPAFMYQFALDPEEEARQVAQRAVADGRTRALVLLPNNEWGRRLYAAFDTQLRELGGAIAGMRFYDSAARDFSDPIRALLLIDESRARANALASTLGMRMEFEPRRRSDAHFIFIGAQPVQGRSIRPALRFHLAGDLPVYATSDIFEPDVQKNRDLEGVLFPDMPWVISPDSVSSTLRATLSRHWPARAAGRGRLYAFGFDAYRLVPLLHTGRIHGAHAIPGMTGRLSVDERGRVHRVLGWARIADGQPTPLEIVSAAVTGAR